MSRYSCETHGYFSSTEIDSDVPCPWCERNEEMEKVEQLTIELEQRTKERDEAWATIREINEGVPVEKGHGQ